MPGTSPQPSPFVSRNDAGYIFLNQPNVYLQEEIVPHLIDNSLLPPPMLIYAHMKAGKF